jgi:hypothetical protein
MPLAVVQRGHVGRTSGATGAAGEQEFNIAASERAKEHLNRVGWTVRLIDAADGEDQRNSYRGDVFFAIHYDSSVNPEAHGASVGYRNPEGNQLAQAWKRHYAANGWTRGFKPDNYTTNLAKYYGVARAVVVGNIHACILECGFGSNEEDAALLKNPAGHDRVGIAIAAAVVDIFGAKCPPAPNTSGLPDYPGLAKLGDRGPNVTGWQKQFNARGIPLAVDGIFGPKTHAAVTEWQFAHGLVVDGIAGPETWCSLLLAP